MSQELKAQEQKLVLDTVEFTGAEVSQIIGLLNNIPFQFANPIYEIIRNRISIIASQKSAKPEGEAGAELKAVRGAEA